MRKEFAYLYPEPLWGSGEWVKNVLLLFDGVTLLVPNYMRDAPWRVDVEIGQPLHDLGLLRILSPEELVDQEVAEGLATALADLIVGGAFDGLSRSDNIHNLSLSRLGNSADRALSSMILDELRERGLAERSVDGVSVPVHQLVRWTVLVLLSQLLCTRPLGDGVELEPVTNRWDVHDALTQVLGQPSMPTAGTVYASDLIALGLDLNGIPLDEVLAFRDQHGRAYRSYTRGVRELARALGSVSDQERTEALADRREALEDELADLRKLPERSWRAAGGVLLGVVGATYKATVKGDLVEAFQDFASGALGAERAGSSTGAFGYLVQVDRTLRR